MRGGRRRSTVHGAGAGHRSPPRDAKSRRPRPGERERALLQSLLFLNALYLKIDKFANIGEANLAAGPARVVCWGHFFSGEGEPLLVRRGPFLLAFRATRRKTSCQTSDSLCERRSEKVADLTNESPFLPKLKRSLWHDSAGNALAASSSCAVLAECAAPSLPAAVFNSITETWGFRKVTTSPRASVWGSLFAAAHS